MRSVTLMLLLAVTAFGQRGGFRGGGFHGGSGFHGGGGFHHGGGFRHFGGFHRGPFFRSSFYYPGLYNPGLFYPGLFYGGYWSDAYYGAPPPAPAAPNVIVIYPPAPPASGPEYVREVEAAPAPPPRAEKDIVFSISLKNHTIYDALAYWVDDRTLHFITTDGAQRSAPLDLVDRAESERLNRERGVPFGLPHE